MFPVTIHCCHCLLDEKVLCGLMNEIDSNVIDKDKKSTKSTNLLLKIVLLYLDFFIRLCIRLLSKSKCYSHQYKRPAFQLHKAASRTPPSRYP
jgi:hypothetical protein